MLAKAAANRCPLGGLDRPAASLIVTLDLARPRPVLSDRALSRVAQSLSTFGLAQTRRSITGPEEIGRWPAKPCLISSCRRYPTSSPPAFCRTAPVSLPRRLTQPGTRQLGGRLLAGTAGGVHLSRVMCHRTIRRDAAEIARRVCVTLVDPLESVARPDEWGTTWRSGPSSSLCWVQPLRLTWRLHRRAGAAARKRSGARDRWLAACKDADELEIGRFRNPAARRQSSPAARGASWVGPGIAAGGVGG